MLFLLNYFLIKKKENHKNHNKKTPTTVKFEF